MKRLTPILALLFATAFGAVYADAQSRAEKLHRPANGINAFIEGCLRVSNSADAANKVFKKYDLGAGNNNGGQSRHRRASDFPFGSFLEKNPRFADLFDQKYETRCPVLIRSKWLSSADAPVVARLDQMGCKKTKGAPARERIRGVRIENGKASGHYVCRGKPFFVMVAQNRQRAGHATELAFVELTKQ